MDQSLKKIDCPPSTHQSPIFPQLQAGLHEPCLHACWDCIRHFLHQHSYHVCQWWEVSIYTHGILVWSASLILQWLAAKGGGDETGSLCGAQSGLKVTVFLPLTPKSWGFEACPTTPSMAGNVKYTNFYVVSVS